MQHARLLLRHSTLRPFKLNGKQMIQCVCCTNRKLERTFNNPYDFRRHFSENHATDDASDALQARGPNSTWPRVDITELCCRLCDECYIFDSIKTLALHLNQRHDVKVIAEFAPLVPIRLEVDRFVCVLCDKVTATLLHLYAHSGKHFSRYICDHCDRNFETQHGLVNHLNQHHSDAAVQCKRCKKVVPSKKALKEHTKTSEFCFPYACGICRKRFRTYPHREQHMVDVHDKPKKIYPCTECDKVFEKRNALYLHFKVTHTDDFKCNLCSKKFDTKRAFTEHTNRHAGIMPFPCTHCARVFPSEHRLKSHMRKHDPARVDLTRRAVIDCPVCSSKFHDKNAMKTHVSHTHPELYVQYFGKRRNSRKMHCCSVCPYAGHEANRLKQHMKRVHPDLLQEAGLNAPVGETPHPEIFLQSS